MEKGWLLPDLGDELARGFWEGSAKGELRVQQCGQCGERRMPPRPMCPSCRSIECHWVAMSGRGTIWSWIVPHPPLLPAFAEFAPYPVTTVALAEDPGLRMVGNLVASAELLNKKMREIRDSGKVVGLDRVAVMAALNMANELLKRTGDEQQLKDIVGLRVKAMTERLDAALGPGQQLNF